MTPSDGTLYVNCRSSNNWSVLQYTADQIDVIAVFNPREYGVYYVPVDEMRKGAMQLRLDPPQNGQKVNLDTRRIF